ncbi:hypothetical protein OH76DRAFT_1561285 [Lentinus brumalis]|uniref:Uncharacterized protein n=1 Tax=Lentinus brumalis TaxID=2498619 RepID=A0A371CNQ5_9APHY|nr:hypothetical protein OH76DRAFT_1561285 [Polyporus brumalis]
MSMDCPHPSTAAATTPLAIFGTVSKYFPVELLQLVCEAADHSTLYSIALSDRTFNELVTLTLYSTIDLQLFSAIYACTSAHRTSHAGPAKLHLPDGHLSYGRNIHNSRQRHRSTIDIDVELPSLMREEDDAVVAPPAVTGRGLKTLKLFHRGGIIATGFSAFICSLIAASRDTVEVFSLPDGAYGGWLSAWSSIPPLPALRDLYVPPDFHSLSAFQDTSRIRVLAIAVGRASFRVAPTAFSNLEEVTCSPRELLALLPEPTPHRRPIRSVTLYDVKYGIPQNLGMAEHVGIEGWHLEARPALRALRFSGARLTRLSFPVSEISVPFLEDLLPVFEELEYLYILLQVRRDERAYGLDEVLPLAPLLARMPCLHTFLLCDKTTVVRISGMAETYLDGGPSDFARNEDDQRHALAAYDQHSSSLRRAAFTSDFEWEKREDGWHLCGHVVAEREPIVSDGEDDDEQHDGKDRG